MKIETTLQAKSHFNIIKLDCDGNELYHSSNNYNTITDYGYQQIYGGNGSTSKFPSGASSYGYFRYIGLGSGNNEITNADTGLSNALLFRDGHSGVKPSNPTRTLVEEGGVTYTKIEQYFIWDLGALDDVTFTEVGIFRNSTGNDSMLCGQLTKNSSGVPTAITVLGDEQLVLKYTSYWPTILGPQILSAMGFTHNDVEYEAELEVIESSQYPIVGSSASTGFPGNTNTYLWANANPENNPSSYGNTTNSAGSCQVVTVEFPDRIERTITLGAKMLPYTQPIGAWGIPTGNGTGAGTVRMKLKFSPPLPKDSNNNVQFRFTWTIRWRE